MPSFVAALALIITLAVSAAGAGAPATTAAASDGATGPTGDSSPLESLSGATIAVDPGHNGANWKHPAYINRLVPAGGFRKECDTTGTDTADGKLAEAAFTWDVAQRLKRLLEHAGAKVVLTRKSNTGVGPCINRRAAIGNRAKADVAISIHGDGGPSGGRGFHVIHPGYIRGYTGPIVKPSLRLALGVRAALDKAGLRRANYIAHNGLIARKDLGGLNLSKVPKVLTELGNMQNGVDARHMENAAWRQRVARALRDALAKYLAQSGK